MDNKVNYTIVGAFVVALSAAMVMGIIWLSAGFTLQHYNKYMVYMKDSVSGLSLNSSVEFNGVEVGSVVSITLNHRDPQLVELLLEIESSTPITTATVATLRPRGITGITYVSLQDQNATRTPLVAKRGQPYPVIRSGPSIFTRIDTMLESFSTNFEKMTDVLNELLDKRNLQSISDILDHMNKLTDELAKNRGKITVILDNTSVASQQLNALLRSGSSSMRMLESQTLPMTYQMLANLNAMSQTVNQLALELKRNPSMLIRGTTPAPPGPGEKR